MALQPPMRFQVRLPRWGTYRSVLAEGIAWHPSSKLRAALNSAVNQPCTQMALLTVSGFMGVQLGYDEGPMRRGLQHTTSFLKPYVSRIFSCRKSFINFSFPNIFSRSVPSCARTQMLPTLTLTLWKRCYGEG